MFRIPGSTKQNIPPTEPTSGSQELKADWRTYGECRFCEPRDGIGKGLELALI